MRKTMLSLLLTLAATAGWAQQWSVTGRVAGLNDGDTLELHEYSHIQQPVFAQAIVSGGEFRFSGQLDEPRVLRLFKRGMWGGPTLVLHAEDVRVDGRYSEESEAAMRRGHFDVTVGGSTLTDQFNEKVKAREFLDQLYQDTHEPYAAFSRQLHAAMNRNDSAEVKRLRNSDEYRKMSEDNERFFDTVKTTFRKMTDDNRDSWWGPFFMIYNLSYLTEQDSTQYNLLMPAAQQSYYGRMVREEIFPNDKTGEQMPLFTITESERGAAPLALAEVCKQNKYTLLDFWASWCGPCRKEIPNLKALYEQFHAKGLEILSVSIDKNVEQWRKACAEEQLPWLSYHDTEGVDGLYKVQFIPAMFLLDSEGRLVVMNIRGEELAAKMAELLP